MKRIAILGSTGSIGTQALEVIGQHPERFEVAALAAGGNLEVLAGQIWKFHPRVVSVRGREEAARLRDLAGNNGLRVTWGEEGACEVAAGEGADLVLSAIVGAAGLRPTFEALRAGRPVALANKESMVIAGELMTAEAKAKGVPILPVDSEHSAIFQALAGNRREDVDQIVLTASGGPFFRTPSDEFGSITPEMALRHPTWQMGSKITIDSATLMNKGLEVIEASWLFGLPVSQIAIQIHPQSIVHSLVSFRDGSVLAQMGLPDMRCAISYSLAYPERIQSGVGRLNLSQAGPLTFFDVDRKKFPAVDLAYRAASEGKSLPAVLNAANEVAVARFLDRRIGFPDMARIVEKTLERHNPFALRSLADVLEADRWARGQAEAL